MIEAVAIRRGKDLGDILDSYNPATPEQEGVVATVGENPFSALFEKYEAFLGRYDKYKKVDQIKLVQNFIHDSSTIIDILTSDEINQFLQTTIIYENREEYGSLTGIFITKLIQNSYNAGNNDFQLDTKSLTKNIDWLGAFLKGRKEEKLQISITGNVGNQCGRWTKNSTFNITGDVGSRCCMYANNSTFNITGNVKTSCGFFANYSTFNITGVVEDYLGVRANNSTFNITGDVGDWCGWGAKYSTYTITGDVGGNCGMGADNSTFNITGDVGSDCGRAAKNSTCTITGNVGSDCGWAADNSTFNIFGNVGNDCGRSAKNSTFNIFGNVGNDYGRKADNSTFNITGDVGEWCGWYVNNSTYKAHTQETLQKLLAVIPYGNRIIYVDNEKETVYGNYSPTRLWYKSKNGGKND